MKHLLSGLVLYLCRTPPKDYALDRCAYFLSFNYTDTFEVLYGIPEESIIHIHGRASFKEKLVVGHNRVIDPGDYWNDSLDMRENNERMQRLMDTNFGNRIAISSRTDIGSASRIALYRLTVFLLI